MKKVFAILLLSIYLFNLAGYTLLFRYLQQKNTEQTLSNIDEGSYADSDLVLVKVPVLLPYSTNWSEYERYDGEIEWGGVHYNYVKRKIYNDTLYLLCLPDIHRTKLNDAQDRYAKQVNDFPSSKKGNDTTIKKAAAGGEYDQQEGLYALSTPIVMNTVFNNAFSPVLIYADADCIIQPPDTSLV